MSEITNTTQIVNPDTQNNPAPTPAADDAEKKAAEKAARKAAEKAAKEAADKSSRDDVPAATVPLTPETLDPPFPIPENRAYYPDELQDMEAKVRKRYATASPEEKPVIKQIIRAILATKVKYTAPLLKGEDESPLFVCLNQKRFSIARGVQVEIPYDVFCVIRDSERQGVQNARFTRQKAKEAEALS